MQSVIEMLGTNRIVPVVKIEEAARAPDVGGALVDAGITVIEITFRTPAAAEAIGRCRDVKALRVGAGTVRTTEQVDRAIDGGAEFLVAPGFDPAIVEHAAKRGIPHIPGTITPSEIERAVSYGLEVLKFFPAESAGGTGFLKAVSAVFPEVSFVPTGGINAANLAEYLALPNVAACGGSWMVKSDWIAGGDYARIETAAREAVAAVS
ncbi:MAG: bifunctional 4-hydroxy-2-oxoglutarate aldolase/2-dehydro-3-deoxy-phosphogluconate aldolase [Spirochaetales bacterium]|nr:bifunctional 4-hydroxy-2-oxoglutarate aldolase/2-dehydro-3-deoxy-phosphogluconate aldolase [Spirochaetales bacterium]